MIWVLLLVFAALFAVGLYISACLDHEIIGGIMGSVGILGGLFAFVVAVVLVFEVADLAVIDERIAMYTEENAAIESQIAEVVERYQGHEKEVFADASPESYITLVSLYPELKSDTLVQEQIKVYVQNNQKVKELKEEKIFGSVMKWWLYFGGIERR